MLIHLLSTLTLAGPALQDTVTISLRLEPERIHVSARYPEVKAGPITFSIPAWAGVDDFGAGVTGVTVRQGRDTLLVSPAGAGWRVLAAAADLDVSYAIVGGKQSFVGTSREDLFRPTLLRDFAFAWGHAWWLVPEGGGVEALPIRVILDPGPYRWGGLLPGWGVGTMTVGALGRSVLVAGEFRRDSAIVAGRSYRFYVHGRWPYADSTFGTAVRRIVEAQAKAMGSLPGRGASVVLVPGSAESQGGTVDGDIIVLYPDPARPLLGDDPGTLRLVAHEHFHRWNGDRSSATDGVGEGYYKWFQEGMTEYLADLTLLRAGLLSRPGFVDRVNDKIRRYVGNPVATSATAAILAERYWMNQDYRQLPYDKGFLLGLLTDLRLRGLSSGTRTIDDYVRAVLETDSTRYDDRRLLDALGAAAGGSDAWEEYYTRYMLGAEPLPVEDLCRTPNPCRRAEETVFAWGFTTDLGVVEGGAVVSEVRPEGNAGRAGLQVGDSLTGRVSYWNGDPTKEAMIEVVRRGGAPMRLRFFPAGHLQVPQLAPDRVPWVTRLAE